ncbi:hypothetical protein AB3S75_009194 [Citrus x aurantiifolia]
MLCVMRSQDVLDLSNQLLLVLVTKTDVRIHQKVLVESSQWVADQRLNRRLDRHVNKKGLECQGHNFLRPHNKACLCKKEFLEVPFELNCYKNPYMAQRTYSSQHGFTHGASACILILIFLVMDSQLGYALNHTVG